MKIKRLLSIILITILLTINTAFAEGSISSTVVADGAELELSNGDFIFRGSDKTTIIPHVTIPIKLYNDGRAGVLQWNYQELTSNYILDNNTLLLESNFVMKILNFFEPGLFVSEASDNGAICIYNRKDEVFFTFFTNENTYLTTHKYWYIPNKHQISTQVQFVNKKYYLPAAEVLEKYGFKILCSNDVNEGKSKTVFIVR